MTTELPRGARRSHPVRQSLFAALLLLSPAIANADSLAIGRALLERGRDADSVRFPLKDSSSLRVVAFTNSDLSFLRGAAAFFAESRQGLASLGGEAFPGALSLEGRSAVGAVLMPNYQGYPYATVRESAAAEALGRTPAPIGRSDLERSLALASYSLVGGYRLRIRAAGGTAISLSAGNELSARLAYDFFDLAPSLDCLGEGLSISETLSSYYTGTSFSRLKDRAYAALGADFGGGRALKAAAAITFTDLMYEEHRLELSFAWQPRLELTASFASASYRSYNGADPNRLGLALSAGVGDAASFKAEALISSFLSVEAEASLRLALSLARPAAGSGAPGAAGAARRGAAVERPLFAGGEAPGGSALPLAARRVAAVDRDLHAILELEDRPFLELVDILYAYRRDLYRYDYARATDLFAADRLRGRDPREFLDEGGVCVDAARFIGTVLENNSIRVRTTMVQPLGGSMHAFVVARDTDGTFYAVDGFSRALRFGRVDSFAAAAAAYGGPFAQLVTMDLAGRVDAVLVSPDIEALDSILGF
jgi:hypothetical protein